MPVELGLAACAAAAFAAGAVGFAALTDAGEVVAFAAAGISLGRVSAVVSTAGLIIGAGAALAWGLPQGAGWVRAAAAGVLVPLGCCASLPFAVLCGRTRDADVWGPMAVAVAGAFAVFGVELAVLHSAFAAVLLLDGLVAATAAGLYRATRL